MFGYKKRKPAVETPLQRGDLLEEINLATATSLVASGDYESLEEAIMKTFASRSSYGSGHDFSVSDDEAALFDDGSELARAQAELERALGLSDDEIARITQEEYDQNVQDQQQRVVRMREKSGRLNAALEQASRWSPPDKMTDELKKKLVKLIEGRISEFDQGIERLESEPIRRPSVTEYRDRLVKNWRSHVASLESAPSWRARSMAEKAKRDAWVESLRQSFAPQSHT